MTDRVTIRIVVAALACLVLLSVGLVGLLGLQEKAIPDALLGALSGGIGALAGILAKTSSEPPP